MGAASLALFRTARFSSTTGRRKVSWHVPMATLIRGYLNELTRSLRRIAEPIDDTILRDLYVDKNYPGMLGWIKKSMHLDLRVGLRITERRNGNASMWIETPTSMPPYGTEDFRRTQVIVNARHDVLQTQPFQWIVAGFAHELAHVVLFSIGHPLQNEEKAVDLTAMILGYGDFIVASEQQTTTRTGSYWRTALGLPFGVLYLPGSEVTDRAAGLPIRERSTGCFSLPRKSAPPQLIHRVTKKKARHLCRASSCGCVLRRALRRLAALPPVTRGRNSSLSVPPVIFTLRPFRHLAGQHLVGERVLHLALDDALQRPRAVDRVVALVGQPFARRLVEVERDLALLEQPLRGGRAGCRRSAPCRCASAGGTG